MGPVLSRREAPCDAGNAWSGPLLFSCGACGVVGVADVLGELPVEEPYPVKEQSLVYDFDRTFSFLFGKESTDTEQGGQEDIHIWAV